MVNGSVTYFGALIAGLLSFFSPCVLPLFPSYATFLGGFSETGEHRDHTLRQEKFRVVGHALLFIAGFSAVFILLGASATTVGQLLQAYRREIIILAGILITVFGLFLTGIIQPLPLLREYRFIQLSGRVPGVLFSFIAGAGFGLAWTPCIGPYLGSILALAASAVSVKTGILMLTVYSAGLAVPFLLGALGMEWLLRKIGRRHKLLKRIQQISGVFMILVGILLITGVFEQITQWLIQFFNAH